MSVQNITLFRIKRKGISVSVLAPTFLFIGKSISIRPDTSRTNISWHLYFILLAYALWYLHCRIHLWPSLPSPDCRPFTSGQLSSGGCTGDWVRNEQEQKYHKATLFTRLWKPLTENMAQPSKEQKHNAWSSGGVDGQWQSQHASTNMYAQACVKCEVTLLGH